MKCAKVKRKLRKQVAGPKWQGPRRLLRHNKFTPLQRGYIEYLIKSGNFKKLEAYVKMTVTANDKLAAINRKAMEADAKKRELKSGLYEEICPKCHFTMVITIEGDLSKTSEPGGAVRKKCGHCEEKQQ